MKISAISAIALLLVGCGDKPPPPPSQGQIVWEGTCRVCHLNGVAGAPRMGDSQAWAPRIEQGMETLIDHATNGFTGSEGLMPPKGGNAALSEKDVADAVHYMVAQSQ